MIPSYFTLEDKISRVLKKTVEDTSLINRKVTLSNWKSTLFDHPEFPEIRSVVDTLSRWRYNYAVARITSEQLDDVPLPFIAVQNDQSAPYIVVRSRSEGYLDVYDGEKSGKISFDSFMEKWSRLIIVIDSVPNSGDENYLKHRAIEIIEKAKAPVLILMILGVYIGRLKGLLATESYPVIVAFGFYLILSLLGLYISYLLVTVSFDKKFAARSRVCGNADDGSGCTTVLESSGAKFLGLISWADIGFMFFFGLNIALFLAMLTDRVPDLLFAISSLSFLMVLYPIYSVLYQAFIIKNWCRLCLVIQCILVLFPVGRLLLDENTSGSTIPFELLFLSFVASIAFQFKIFPLWKSKISKIALSESLDRFRKNRELINLAFQGISRVEPPPEDAAVFHIGDPNAKNVITIVTNPYCEPCALAHEQLTKIIDFNPTIRSEILVFATPSKRDLRRQVGAHWLALSDRGEDFKAFSHHWYNSRRKDFPAFQKQYQVQVEEIHYEKLMVTSRWIKSVGISATPTIFINGKMLPDSFRLEDMKHYLINI